MKQVTMAKLAWGIPTFVWLMSVSACSGSPQPQPQTPVDAQAEMAKASDEVTRLTKFLHLCNTEDNGGIAKFEPQHTESYGRGSRFVPTYIECKNGLGASYRPVE